MEMEARHIAMHLIRIALFALPRSTGIEVDQDGRSTASNENATQSECTGLEGMNFTASNSSSVDNQSSRRWGHVTDQVADAGLRGPELTVDSLKMIRKNTQNSETNSRNSVECQRSQEGSDVDPRSSTDRRQPTLDAHEAGPWSEENQFHGSQKPIEETTNSIFNHAESPNQIHPELATQNMANIPDQSLRNSITPKVFDNPRHQPLPSYQPSPDTLMPNHRPVKGILRPPREKFPWDQLPVREGVAALSKRKGIPPDARWTKIDRKLVNPEALETGNERYEERQDYVIVLRVLTKDEIEAYAIKTAEIRAKRGILIDSSSVA